jgi:hypothetical protein
VTFARAARTHLLLIVAATLAVSGVVWAPAEVRAATPDLTIVTAARYDVQPPQKRIRVSVDLTLTNRLKDTTTRRYFFDHAFLAVMPGASGYRLSWEGAGQPSVSVARRTATHTLLRLNLARDLPSGRSAKYRLTFELKDPGGKATRDLRIGDTLVSFPVWAFASDDTPGSSVTVVFPKGYDVAVEAGRIPAPDTLADGRTIFRSGVLAKPLDFFAYLVADRPGAYIDTTVKTTVEGRDIEVIVSAWTDDRPWARRVAGLLDSALPVLGGRIGLPWPDYDQPMRVQEAVSRSTGGYAGIFDPAAGTVAIAYYADDFVVLHEAAHAWFNGSLLADRWSNEAFASYYGVLAAEDLELRVAPDRLTPELEKARIPLNGWGPVGTVDVTQEDYAYAASLALAREIAKRASPDGLKTVWADVSDRRSAYQPVGGGDEIVGGPVDWRGLLDLLEARSDATFDDLWRTWVARPEDIPLLDARLAARTRYDAFLETVSGWDVPLSIRDAMRSWRFKEANALIDGAASVIELRAEVEAAVGMAGLTAPPSLRSAFEDDDGFDDAMAEADAELLAVERYVAAVSQRPAAMSPLMTLGLWGETPEDDLLAAKGAFAAGDLATATAAADEAAASWTNAESMGQGRAFSIGTIVISLLFILSLMIVTFRRRRRRRVRMQATRLRT